MPTNCLYKGRAGVRGWKQPACRACVMTGERGVQEGALWEGEDKEEPEGSRDL